MVQQLKFLMYDGRANRPWLYSDTCRPVQTGRVLANSGKYFCSLDGSTHGSDRKSGYDNLREHGRKINAPYLAAPLLKDLFVPAVPFIAQSLADGWSI